MKRFRGGLVFKAHRLVFRSTLGLRVIQKKKEKRDLERLDGDGVGVREVREGESETTGYGPFALHAPIHWALLGGCDQEHGR